jgi:glycosyltransferase involved in cell wall biosynthesis
MKRPAILFVETSPYPSYGGSKRVLVNLVSGLDPGRWEPKVLFYRSGLWVADAARHGAAVQVAEELLPGGPPAGREPHGLGARLRRLGVHPMESGDVVLAWPRRWVREARFHARMLWSDARASRRLEPFLPEPVDLVHLNNSMHSGYDWYHLLRRHRIPYLLHEHGIWKTPPRAWRQVALGAAAVLCLTRDRMEQVRDFCGESVRAELLPNGVPPESFGPHRPPDVVRRELGVEPQEALLVTAGHLQAWKGQDLAVEAAHQLAGAGFRFVWILCGSTAEPDFERELRERIRRHGLEDRVRMLGERRDLADLFAAADLAVHTSILPEPFGMVIVEAMAAGTAVVGPAEGALPDIIRDGTDGRLVRPRDTDALFQALAALLRDPAAMRAMGEAARERARDAFRVDTQVRALETIYERALVRR